MPCFGSGEGTYRIHPGWRYHEESEGDTNIREPQGFRVLVLAPLRVLHRWRLRVGAFTTMMHRNPEPCTNAAQSWITGQVLGVDGGLADLKVR